MMASNTFAFPFHKKQQKIQSVTSSRYPVELSDFSGVWGEGKCTGFDEEEDDDEEEEDGVHQLTITQNKKQISITFGDDGDYDGFNNIVLNLNQLSSLSNSTHAKRAVAIQHVSVPYSDMISIDYEYMDEEGSPETGGSLLRTWMHVDLVKKGDTLEMRDPRTDEVCTFKKIG